MTRLFGLTLALAFLCSSTIANAQIIVVPNDSDCRLVTEPSGARDDNNGGDTITGALIGINTGSVDNFMVYEFSDLSAVAGQTIVSATVEVAVATGFANANHGSDQDIINMSEIALPNLGWVSGMGTITADDTPADNGSISFLNRVQFNGSGTTEPWLDTNGLGVANLLGTLTPVATAPGWNQGSAPTVVSFTIDPATAQRWVDNGLGGLVMSTTDDGDSRSRFNMMVDGASIVFETSGGGVVEVAPATLVVMPGVISAGDISSLADSDNDKLRIFRDVTSINAVNQFVITGTSPSATPSAMSFTLEGNCVSRPNVVQRIRLWDYSLGQWELVDEQNANRTPSPDLTVTVELAGDLSRFVDQTTNEMMAEIRYRADLARASFASATDQAVWTVTP